MPEVTMEMNAGGADATPDIYVEDGFAISTGSPPSLPGQTPNGLTLVSTGGGYLTPTFSNGTVFLESTTPGKTFGLLTIDLDGSHNFVNEQGEIDSSPAEVLFTIIGINPNLLMPLEVTFTTDLNSGFQTFELPEEFTSGLVQVFWTATDGANVWGSFDNLVLATNSAPTATGVQGATGVDEDGSITGQLAGTDADNDPLTYALVNPVDGVGVATDGAFTVDRLPSDDDLLPGQTRTVTFEYTVSDGYEVSTPTTVSVLITGAPLGPDIRLGNRPQSKDGTAASERMFGGNSGDTLCGLGGSDTLSGENGTDSLCGDDGRDRLLGGNGSDTLYGGAGSDWLDGGNSPDVLFGGLGDDTMTGGNSPDEFYLGADWGHDVITDFDPKNEHIHLVPSPTLGGWTDFLSLKADGYIKQVGANVVIDDAAGNTLVLLNVKLTSLNEGDFIFG